MWSRSVADSGALSRMLVIEPSELITVAPLSRTSSQNPDAEKRVPSATVAPAHSAA